ncbi:hypothetical protein KAR48_12505 [bacterium]|nr:hypothetical protein [bacterium]
MLNKTSFRGLLSGKKKFTLLLIFASSQLFAQLSGTYPVGSGQTYATLTAAVADINSNGVSGAVVFELTDASYTTSETFPITINEISGASSTNTITIKPASGVTAEISGNSGGDNTSIIKLYGADYVIIDGSNNGTTSRDLIIINTKTSEYGATVWLASLGNDQGCQNNVIKNCKLSYGAKSGVGVISFSASSNVYTDGGYDNNDNTIENNEIYKCNRGIYLIAPSAEKNSNNIIRNNLIGSNNSSDSFYEAGIYCLYQNSIEISGNEVFNSINDYDVYGLFINNCTAVIINKNKIHRILSRWKNKTRGISIFTDVSNPDITISNNMIWHVASKGTDDSRYFPTGIYIDGNSVTTGIRLYFNSIYLIADGYYGLDNFSANSASLLISGSTGIDCRNNIFRNSLGEKSGSSRNTSCYAVYVNDSSNPFSISDNNIYYSSSTSDNNYIGGNSSTDYSTLSGWQGFTGDDDLSYNLIPDFVSETDLDLSASNNGAVGITGYSTDHHDETRSSPPDIGADESSVINVPYVATGTVVDNDLYSREYNGNIVNDNYQANTARGACWSTSSNPTTSDSHTTDGSGEGTFTSSITGLSLSTTYYVRGYATNSIGTNYGDNIEFTTTDGLPDVTTSSITQIIDNSASGGGENLNDDGQAITAKGVCWSTSSDPTTSSSHTNDGTGTDNFTSSITGLNSTTTYYVRAYVTNSIGTNYGGNVEFTTTDGLPDVTTSSITQITENTASGGGENLNDDGHAITAKGVCWSTSSNPTTADSFTDDGTGTDNFSSSITGLNSSTTYYVRAYVTNSIGTNYGDNVEFTTTDGLPDVTTSSITQITGNSATGGGENLNDDGHAITVKGVCWSISSNPTTADSFTDDGTGTDDYTSLITGLNATTTYYVRAYVTNSEGISYGSNAEFTTTTYPPGNALEFDGVEEYANLGDSQTLKPTSALTVQLWAYSANWPNFQYERLISNTQLGGYNIGAGTTGNLACSVYLNGNYVTATVDQSGLVTGWHHFALTCDGRFVKLYVDGVLENTGDAGATYSITYDSDNCTFLGAEVNGGWSPDGHYFSGKLDEVSIWSIARTEQQIRENINRTLSGNESGLVAYYKLDETAGYSIENQSSSYDGTTVNMGHDAWVESTIPIGAGASNSQTAFTTGTATLGNLSVTTTDAFDNAVDLFCAEIENSPNTTSGATDNMLDKYFVLYAFGTPGTFSTDLTFTLEEGFISAADQAAPSNLKLYKRTSTADGDWTLETSGTEATSTTVKFEGITSYSQFIIGQEDGVRIQTKLFLEGPYDSDTDEMTTSLTVPTTSPYSEDARTVGSIPADITDWVLVELRSTADGTAVVSRSALLHKDGRIVADDGTTSYIEMSASASDYFIVIKHRNHLAVESDEVHTLSSGSSTLYDFTVDASTSYDKYYGGDAAILETGVYGMYAGDTNNSGIVTNSDKDSIISNLNSAGYYDADSNCSGIVTNSDKDAIIANLNKSTAVN